MAIHTCSGWLLPLRVTGWQSSKAKTFSVAAWVASPTATAIGGAAACRRAATLTASPVRKPSPLAGLDVEAHQGLAGVDADADLDGLPADAGQGVDLVDQPQAGAHRPLRVVLVQGGYAEDRDHGVADVLLDDPAVGLDDATCRRVVAAQHGVDEFGVVALGDGGEADEVAEERRDDAALLAAPPRGQPGAATGAGCGALGRVAAAAGTGGHRSPPPRGATTGSSQRIRSAPSGCWTDSTPRPAPPEGGGCNLWRSRLPASRHQRSVTQAARVS